MSEGAQMQAGDIVEGRYRIVSTLGEGGMGTVFLAEHILIQRRLALKILHAQLAEDIEIVERFMNEARAAGTLGHPNIVESTDMGFTRENVPYIVFEYLQGTLLTDEIYRVNGLPVRRALRIAHQIASALDAAHNAGIVHRDLKSDNVFLTDREDVSDHVKVLDFGVSRFAELDSDKSGPGQVMGTPEYMAPEQITSPNRVDARADIYGLGVILYEMLTARCPFRVDNDSHAVMEKVVNEPPPPLEIPGLPPGLQEMILTKLLAKDPDERYATMKDVANALEAFHLIIRPAGSVTPLSIPSQELPAGVVAQDAVLLPPAMTKKHPIGWLLAALVAGGTGTALAMVGDRLEPNTTAVPALQAEMQKLAASVENAMRAQQLRAEGVATTPMLRAAIETDAATLKDMAGADFLFTPKPGEVLEVFQLRGGESLSMLRIPETAPPITKLGPNETRVETDGAIVRVVVSAPVTTQSAAVGGSLALSTAIDLTPAKQGVTPHAMKATLTGFSKPIELASTDGVGDSVTIPVPLSPELKAPQLTLSATIAPPVARKQYERERFIGWGLGAALLVLYLVRLLAQRSRG